MAQATLLGPDDRRQYIREQRWELLDHLHTLLEKPLTALSFAWLVLILLNLTVGLTGWLNVAQYVLWGIFVLDFLVEFVIAPHKLTYLKRHWLVAVALALPALSMLRFIAALRVLGSASAAETFDLAKIITSFNRGMSALNRVLGRRGVGYVSALTVIVVVLGAAGMLAFESQTALRQAGYGAAVSQGAGFRNYGDALWWTAMIMTTMGSQYWPITAAGRVLCFLLSIYAFAVFGYITATIATFFIGRDQEADAAAQTAAGAVGASAPSSASRSAPQSTTSDSATSTPGGDDTPASGGAGVRGNAAVDAPATSPADDALRRELAQVRARLDLLLAQLDGRTTPATSGSGDERARRNERDAEPAR